MTKGHKYVMGMLNLMLFTKSGDSMEFDLCIYVGVLTACVFAKTENIFKFCIPLYQIEENQIILYQAHFGAAMVKKNI